MAVGVPCRPREDCDRVGRSQYCMTASYRCLCCTLAVASHSGHFREIAYRSLKVPLTRAGRLSASTQSAVALNGASSLNARGAVSPARPTTTKGSILLPYLRARAALMEIDGQRVAVYRDKPGALHALSVVRTSGLHCSMQRGGSELGLLRWRAVPTHQRRTLRATNAALSGGEEGALSCNSNVTLWAIRVDRRDAAVESAFKRTKT